MAIQVKHSKVSTIPDTDDTSLVRPSDWNADHVLTGTIPVANGGTGADNPTDARTNLSAAKSGANSDITSMTGVTGGISSPDYIQFDTTYATTLTTGQLGWDGNDTLGLGMSGGNVVQEIGLQTFIYGKASSAITKGQLIKKTGATGSSGVITFAPTTANMTNSSDIIGIAAEDIALNGFGYIMSTGNLRGFNTTGASSGETWADGDTLYYNLAGNGLMTKTKPSAPNSKTEVAIVTNAGSGGSGSVVVEIIHGSQLGGTDSNVQITSPTTGQTLVYNQSTDIWNNSNAPTIIGGSINNTPIGATTPSTGAFTTITGQTGVLRGTGQNLSLQSEQVNLWGTPSNATVVIDATTSPTGTSNADKLQENTANSNHFLSSTNQSLSYVLNLTYTRSCYIKQDGRKYVSIFFPSTNFPSTGRTAIFDVNAGTVYLAESGVTAIITSVGNGWFRCSITVTCTVAGSGHTGGSALYDNSVNSVYLGDGTSGAFLWGAQVELGSTANTYIPTTTTAVYGTPTLSFSGVSTLGLESNGALFLQPAGTGAIQAQATTSTTAGGNARGANAVDWQTARGAASQVASAQLGVIGGGTNNTVTGAIAGVLSGGFSAASGQYAVVAGGAANTAGQYAAGVVAGQGNGALGYFNLIGGGFTNSGTSGSAVTTQSGTMNGTTAVTLSGSNANIKVGQYISGTSIAADTYVAAISGTSLTLSKNASGSSTSTLSFFTPHGVVVGGGNNQATGAYSFIGGGGDAGTAANRNVASGDWSVVGGGWGNKSTGKGAFIGGGGVGLNDAVFGNTSSGPSSVIVGGISNTSSGYLSGVLAGGFNAADANASSVIGGRHGTTRGIVANTIFPASYNPIASNLGIHQAGLLVLARETTNATPTVLASDVNAASTTNQVILPNNSAYYFRGEVIAGKTAGGDTKGWFIEGVIKRGANAASTAIVGTATVTSNYADAGSSTWAVTATADTTNGGLKITVTGQASTTIRWVAQIRTTEMTF